MSDFLTESDLAEALGVDESMIRKWRQQYGWPHIKIGRQVRFTEADVRAITSQHHVSGERVSGLPGQTSRSIARSA